MIPKKHTGFGEDKSPEFMIRDIPDGVVSFAIIMDDLDVPFTEEYALTIEEAAEYSNIGQNRISELLKSSRMLLCFVRWKKEACETCGIRTFYIGKYRDLKGYKALHNKFTLYKLALIW